MSHLQESITTPLKRQTGGLWRACCVSLLFVLCAACAPQDLSPYTPENNTDNNMKTDMNNAQETQFEQVSKVLATNCGTAGCHNQDSFFEPKIQGGVDATPEQVKAALDGVSGNGGKPLIVSDNATQSLLWLRVSNTQPPVMPPGGAMPADKVKLIEDWINAGAKYEFSASNNNPGDMGSDSTTDDMTKDDMGKMDMGMDMPKTDMTQNVSFDDVVPLIRQCGSCHDGGYAHLPKIQGGVNATRDQVKAALEDVMSVQDPTLSLIDMIYFRVEGESKGTRMPRSGDYWSQSDINKYKAWIDNGANYN